MRKLLRNTLGAIVAIGLFASTSTAQAVFTNQNLQWRFINSGTEANRLVDSKVIAASVSDTTTWVDTFGLVSQAPTLNIASTDSIAVCTFSVFVDTSYTVPSGSFTCTVQGSYGDEDALVTVSSITVNPTAGQKFFSVPVYLGAGLATATAQHPTDWNKVLPRLRLIVANAGTAWANCRVSFQGVRAASLVRL